ncbi:hypothetical protein ABW19_dt0205222 [Dactylella cylindrospora]|nr:hypothetical protein ABW19_dt0205222 [Dactylella cylindrospora]
MAAALEDGRLRHVDADGVDPFADKAPTRQTKPPLTSGRNPAIELLGVTRHHARVGWKADFLDDVDEDADDEYDTKGWGRRRSSSLPDLPTAGGKQWKSVKGRRATPWVHNIGIGSTNGGGGGVKLAFPTLKRLSGAGLRRLSTSSGEQSSRRLSNASTQSNGNGYEVWYDAVKEQPET